MSTYKLSRLVSINILKFYADDVPPVADPGEGPGGPGPPLFLDQTEGRTPVPSLSKGLDDRVPSPPPPYLKVWIRHWSLPVLRSG